MAAVGTERSKIVSGGFYLDDTLPFVNFSGNVLTLDPDTSTGLAYVGEDDALYIFDPVITYSRPEVPTSVILSGKLGSIKAPIILYESNIKGEEIRPLEGTEERTISMSNYRDWAWELSLKVSDNDAFDFYSGYVKAKMVLSAGNITREFGMGLYRFESPKSVHEERTSWDLKGNSLEWLALSDSYPRGYLVASGTPVLQRCREILTNMTPPVPAERINFPVADVSLTSAVYFDPQAGAEGLKKLRVINTLLNAGGFYGLYTDADGRFTTSEIESFRDEPPSVYYATEEGRVVAGAGGQITSERLIKTEPIPDEYDDTNFANRVVVMSGDANQVPPLYSVAELHDRPVSTGGRTDLVIVVDPDSALSVERLNRIQQGDTISVDTIASQAQLNLIAKSALDRAAGRYRRLQIETILDPRRGLRESYQLYVKLATGKEAVTGKWRVINWTIQEDGSMTHELARIDGGNDFEVAD